MFKWSVLESLFEFHSGGRGEGGCDKVRYGEASLAMHVL
jgi:hypothetical protein